MGSKRARALAKGVRAVLGGAALLLAVGQAAEARVVTLRWTHPAAANVDGFRLHWGTSSGSYTTTVNVGKPAPSSGVYSYDLTVGDNVTVYAVMSAYGDGFLDSVHSNQKTYAPPTTPPPPPPPDGTATWSRDFQTSSTGTAVQGWYDSGANDSLSENDGLFSVFDIGSNRVFGTSSTATNIHAHYVSGTASSWASYEYQGRMRITDPQGGIGVTAYSQYPQADKYYRLRRYGTGAFEISPHGTTVSCTPATTGVVPKTNTWYRFRLEVLPATASSNSIRAKVWQDGTTEPSNWQTSCIDASSSRPTRGTVGVWSMGGGQKAWDDLRVHLIGGSSQTPPPAPILFQ